MDTRLTLESVPSHSPDVVAQVVRGEAILVLAEQSKVKVLNELGTRIWEMVDGQLSIRQIAAHLCQEYEVEPAQAEQDTLEFLAELERRGLLQVRTPPSQAKG
jgi:hypothetical protein